MRDDSPRRPSIQTLAARAGEAEAAPRGRPLVTAIHQSTVYAFASLEELEASYGDDGLIYYRNGHANGRVLEAALAALEGGEDCAVAASGMAAILAGLSSALPAGSHLVADRNAYGGTFALLTRDLPRLGISVTLVDATDHSAVATAITPATRALHVETVSNPNVRVADLAALAGLCRERGLILTVDNSFASPAVVRPLEHGADLVFGSLAKYLGGHASAFGGVLAGRADLVRVAREQLVRQGATPGAFDAWAALQGLKTLPLRMRAHSRNAVQVAAFLAEHPRVTRVEHPSLPSHPQHALAASLYPEGTGGMLSFEVEGGLPGASALVRNLAGRIPLAPSFADVATTLSYPAGTSHRALGPDDRGAIGVTDGLLRLSVGIEDPDDIIADLRAGLDDLRLP
jgi:cystathionine gamma-synthase